MNADDDRALARIAVAFCVASRWITVCALALSALALVPDDRPARSMADRVHGLARLVKAAAAILSVQFGLSIAAPWVTA